MLEFSIKYGPQISPDQYAAYIKGDCAMVKNGTVLQYQDGTQIMIRSVGTMCNGFLPDERSVLLEGKIDTAQLKAFLKTT